MATATGAICGNMLGAWLGLDAIDPSWIEKLELTEEMYAMADALQSVIDYE